MTPQLIRELPHGPFCLHLNEDTAGRGMSVRGFRPPSHLTLPSAQVFVLANFHYGEIGQVYVCAGDFITVRLLSQPHVRHTRDGECAAGTVPLDPTCLSISISTETDICIRHRSAKEEKPRRRAEEFHPSIIKKCVIQFYWGKIFSLWSIYFAIKWEKKKKRQLHFISFQIKSSHSLNFCISLIIKTFSSLSYDHVFVLYVNVNVFLLRCCWHFKHLRVLLLLALALLALLLALLALLWLQ